MKRDDCYEDLNESQSGLDRKARDRVVDVYMAFSFGKCDKNTEDKVKRAATSVGLVFSNSTTGTYCVKSFYLGFKESEYAVLTGFLYMLEEAWGLFLYKLRLHGHIPFLAKLSKGNFDMVDEFHQVTCKSIDTRVSSLEELLVAKEPAKTNKFASLAAKHAQMRNWLFIKRRHE